MVLGKEASTGGIIATFVPLKFPGGTKMFTIIFTRPPFLSERVWVLDLAHTGHYYTYILLVPMLTSDGRGGGGGGGGGEGILYTWSTMATT